MHRREGYVQYAIQLVMTDEDIVAMAADIFNVKYIRAKGVTKSGKSIYRLVIHGPYALGWMTQLYPYLGERRRRKIDECLGEWFNRGMHISKGKFLKRYGDSPVIRLLLSGRSISSGINNG